MILPQGRGIGCDLQLENRNGCADVPLTQGYGSCLFMVDNINNLIS